jgi:hypothetical protein
MPALQLSRKFCVIDSVFATGEDGQVYFSEAGTLTNRNISSVRTLMWTPREVEMPDSGRS